MKVLLVEDEPRLSAALAKGLKQENYNVQTSDNGTEALNLIENNDYDVMLIDRMIPGIDGLQLTKTVRTNGIKTPILILTAKGQTRDKVDGLDAGADDYMTNPVSFEELLARLRALLRRPTENVSDLLTIGDLTLNLSTYVCERAGKPIVLTATELKLLEYLMRNENRVLTKEQIVDHVWDYDAEIMPNTVEAYVSYLRKKVDGKSKLKLIKTVRGFGYKINSEAK
jgi:DNA-binding response OmpR family regulator